MLKYFAVSNFGINYFIVLIFVLIISVLFACFSPVPKDRDKFYFKIKQGIEKKVVITVRQLSNKELAIER